MINNINFDNQSLRKATIAFGALFNSIILEKKDVDGNEIKRIKVPLAYGSKEKYLARILEEKNNDRPTQLPLPRMAFSLVGLAYDPNRKQQTTIKNRSAISGNPLKLNTQFVPVPYDLFFELQILTREVADGLQIIGMILPYFTPDYTVNIKYSSTIGDQANKDTPIILNNMQFEDNTEGPIDEIRLVVWTLTFTMKAYVFGPETSQSQIKKVQISFFDDGLTPLPITTANGVQIFINTNKGSNTYVATSDLTNIVNANSIVLIDNKPVYINSSNNNILTGNVKFTTDAQSLTLESNNPSTVMVARYTAEVVPNTALITDNYTISELFEDFE